MLAYLIVLSAFFQQEVPSAGDKGYINYPAVSFKYKHTGYELTGKDLPPFKAFDRASPIPVTFKSRTDHIRKVWFTVETVKPTGEAVTIILRDYYWNNSPWPVNKQLAGNMMKKRLGLDDSKPASTRASTPSSATTPKPSPATSPTKGSASRAPSSKPTSRSSNASNTSPNHQNSYPQTTGLKKPQVRGTQLFFLVTHQQGLTIEGAPQNQKNFQAPKGTLIPMLNYKHTKKRRHGLFGDIAVPDEESADLKISQNQAVTVDYRSVKAKGEEYEYLWDSANNQITGREESGQGMRRIFHNFILKLNSSFGFVFMLFLIGVPFGMAASFGHAVIKEVDVPLSELVMFGILSGIGILLLWFFGSILGGWYQGHLDSYNAINAKLAAAGGLVPISISASQLPTGVGFLYYVFNIVYIPYLLFCIFLVVRFAWPAALTIHYLFVPHPAERSIKSMLRIGETNRTAMDELSRVMNWEKDLASRESRWKIRNQTRRMQELDKKIQAEETVLDSFLGVLRKKRLAKYLENNS